MTPLEIELLIRLYPYTNPYVGYTEEQRQAPGIRFAEELFEKRGWLVLDWKTTRGERLTPAGLQIIERLKAVDSSDATTVCKHCGVFYYG